jgi:curved DNA-binding protein CbpA
VPQAAPAGVLIPPRPGAPAAAAPAPRRAGPLPETGSVETITPQQAAGLRALAGSLDTLDYYEALGVAHTATPGEIKKAFYRESRTYHPDRFFHLPESQVKEDIGSIYKRMTEAYYVLRDDLKRKKYLADVTGPERKSRLRYTEATEAELKAEARKSVEEEYGTNPKARPYFKTALAELEKGNLPAAISAFKTGLMYEPGNTRFKEKLAEAQKKLDDSRKGATPNFMIK